MSATFDTEIFYHMLDWIFYMCIVHIICKTDYLEKL